MSTKSTDIKELESSVEKIALILEKSKIGDYVTIMQKPRTLIMANFIGGLSRGFGMAIGFTILGAIVLYVLRQAMLLNIPIIGNFIAEIVKIVQDNL